LSDTTFDAVFYERLSTLKIYADHQTYGGWHYFFLLSATAAFKQIFDENLCLVFLEAESELVKFVVRT
jgi:hypothetical protein